MRSILKSAANSRKLVMAGEWAETTWGEIAELKYGKAMKGYTDQPNLARVYGTNGPIGWHDTALQQGPGVVVGRKGAYRGVHYADHPFWVIDTAYYLKPLAPMDLRWAYYWLLDFDVNNIDDGSPIPSTTRDAFGFTPVKFPPLSEQSRIADLLASLDLKINLNRQMVETLDEIAQALFKSWFVDFDPVHAKAKGSDPFLPADIAALFPENFDQKGLPDGWVALPFLEALELTKGNSYKSADLKPSSKALVTLKSFQRGGGYRRDGLKPFDGPYKATQVVHPGDLILAATDVTQAAEIVGQSAIVAPNQAYDELIASLDVMIARPKKLDPWFWGYLLRAQRFPGMARNYTTGTTVLHLSSAVFDDFSFVVPDQDTLLEGLQAVVKPIVEQGQFLELECANLEQVRDAIMPSLLSGELRVDDAAASIAVA